MKLFIREHLSLLIFYPFQISLILLIVWLAGLKDLYLLFYIFLISILLLSGFLLYKYRTRRSLYRILSSQLTSLEDSLRKLDHAPISAAVSGLLLSQYKIFQEQILRLQKKQEEHLIFIDRWVHQMKTPISILELEENKEDQEEENNSTKENEEAAHKGSSLSNYDEYSMLSDRLDLDNLSYDVVEDHHNKRVILFKNKHNHVAYKSIFIKKKNYLKIIDKKVPPVYKGTI